MGAREALFVLAIVGALLAHEILFAGLLLAAAVIDARTRRLPNALAVCLVLAGALCAVMPGFWGGVMVDSDAKTLADAVHDLGFHLIAATGVCTVLVIFELAWRRSRGSAGLGMGDVKLLFALALADPARGLAAFAGGLVLLAIAGLAARRKSLPLIPFVFPMWMVASVVRLALFIAS